MIRFSLFIFLFISIYIYSLMIIQLLLVHNIIARINSIRKMSSFLFVFFLFLRIWCFFSPSLPLLRMIIVMKNEQVNVFTDIFKSIGFKNVFLLPLIIFFSPDIFIFLNKKSFFMTKFLYVLLFFLLFFYEIFLHIMSMSNK